MSSSDAGSAALRVLASSSNSSSRSRSRSRSIIAGDSINLSSDALPASPPTPRAAAAPASSAAAAPSRPLAFVHHARIDSLPPQRYHHDDDDDEPEPLDLQPAAPVGAGRRPSTHAIDFEDITLEERADEPTTPAPRSAELIRKDHVSSHDYRKRTQQDLPPLPPPAPDSHHHDAAADTDPTPELLHRSSISSTSSLPSITEQISPPPHSNALPHPAARSMPARRTHHPGLDSPSSTASDADSPHPAYSRPASSLSMSSSHPHDLSIGTSDGTASLSRSSRTIRRYSHNHPAPSASGSAIDRRRVEGRYRGRHSRPTSRTASPDRDLSVDSGFSHTSSGGRRLFFAYGSGGGSNHGSPSASASASAFDLSRSERQSVRQGHPPVSSLTFASTVTHESVAANGSLGLGMVFNASAPLSARPGHGFDLPHELGYHSDYSASTWSRRRDSNFFSRSFFYRPDQSPTIDGVPSSDATSSPRIAPAGTLKSSVSSDDFRLHRSAMLKTRTAPMLAMNALTLSARDPAAPGPSSESDLPRDGHSHQHSSGMRSSSRRAAPPPELQFVPHGTAPTDTALEMTVVGEDGELQLVQTPTSLPSSDSRRYSDLEREAEEYRRESVAPPALPAKDLGRSSVSSGNGGQGALPANGHADGTGAHAPKETPRLGASEEDSEGGLQTPVAVRSAHARASGGHTADADADADEMQDISLPESEIDLDADPVVQAGSQARPHAEADGEQQRRGSQDTAAESDGGRAVSQEGEKPLPPELESEADKSTDSKPERTSSSSRRSSSAATGAPAAPGASSLTRLSTLPPKAIAEEKAHKALHQDMLVSFRALQAKREAEQAARRQAKEQEWDAVTPVWEKEILPAWTRARRDERLREVWWKGAPPNLRGRVWALVCGNALMLPRNLWTGLSKAVDAALAALEAGGQEPLPEGVWRIPPKVLQLIDEDIEDALPSLKLFQRASGPMWTDLRAFMCALVLLRLEKLGLAPPKAQKAEDGAHVRTASLSGGPPAKILTPDDIEPALLYQPGLAQLGAMLLCNLSPSEALIALLNLIAQRPWLRVLFGPSAGQGGLAPPAVPPASSALHPEQQRALVIEAALSELHEAKAQLARELDGMERVFDTLLADQMPKVFANMQARGVKPRTYLRNWLRSYFASWLPFDAVARLWDVILLDETDAMVYRIALALIQLLESRLYVSDASELVTVLNGRNRVILEVWYRQLSGPFGSARDCEAARLSVGRNWVDPEETEAHAAAEAEESTEQDPSREGSANGDEDGSKTSTDSTAPAPAPVPKPNGGHPAARRAVEADASIVPLDNIFAQYGITEDVLFGGIEAQRGWWKNSLLERLLDRELGM